MGTLTSDYGGRCGHTLLSVHTDGRGECFSTTPVLPTVCSPQLVEAWATSPWSKRGPQTGGRSGRLVDFCEEIQCTVDEQRLRRKWGIASQEENRDVCDCVASFFDCVHGDCSTKWGAGAGNRENCRVYQSS